MASQYRHEAKQFRAVALPQGSLDSRGRGREGPRAKSVGAGTNDHPPKCEPAVGRPNHINDYRLFNRKSPRPYAISGKTMRRKV